MEVATHKQSPGGSRKLAGAFVSGSDGDGAEDAVVQPSALSVQDADRGCQRTHGRGQQQRHKQQSQERVLAIEQGEVMEKVEVHEKQISHDGSTPLARSKRETGRKMI